MTITAAQMNTWRQEVDYWRKKYADLGLQYDQLIAAGLAAPAVQPIGYVFKDDDYDQSVIQKSMVHGLPVYLAAPVVQPSERLKALEDVAALATVGATYSELMEYLQAEITKEQTP